MTALPGVAAPPAGQADPREALYWSLAAELGHQYEHTLASNQEALENDKTMLQAGQGKLDRAEPLQLTGIRNRANREGLLTSGIEAQRTGTQQAGYLTARNQLGTAFQQQQQRINRSNSEAGESYTDKMNSNLAGAEDRQTKEAQLQAERAPTLGAPTESGPALPGVTKGINAPLNGPTIPRSSALNKQIRRNAAKNIVG